MKHLRILKYLNFVMAVLALISSIGALVNIFVPFGCPCNADSGTISVVGGTFTFVLLAGLAMGHIAVGYLVSAQRGRVAQTVLAVLQLIHFPLGTAYGVYAIWVCWLQKETKALFEAKIKPPVV